MKARKTSAVSAVPPAELAKYQKEITDLKKEKEELTKTVKSFEKDKSNWQKQSEDLSGARKDLSSIKKDKDNLSQSLKVVERDLKKVLKDIQPKKVILDYDMFFPGHSVQRKDSTLKSFYPLLYKKMQFFWTSNFDRSQFSSTLTNDDQ